jgi:GT2 family glycosyltransferase
MQRPCDVTSQIANQDTRVSVVIVTRGRAQVLADCLASVQDQSRLPDQIVVVAGDEASCPQELIERIDGCERVRVMCPEPNICKARNLGIDHAIGAIVIFIDDDAVAEQGWIESLVDTFDEHPDAWVVGGVVYDARIQPPVFEFAHGLIRPSGSQIEVRSNSTDPPPREYVTTVKGCNFALHLGRLPGGIRFDPFFRFAFDEADFVLTVHALGGGVLSAPRATVHHLHAPGIYRASSPLDRDWFTEFASHTMFMLKHTRGIARWTGWGVLIRRLAKHTLVACGSSVARRVSQERALKAVLDAFAGVRFAALSRDTDQSFR